MRLVGRRTRRTDRPLDDEGAAGSLFHRRSHALPHSRANWFSYSFTDALPHSRANCFSYSSTDARPHSRANWFSYSSTDACPHACANRHSGQCTHKNPPGLVP